jgi:hypothetical protein
MTLWWIKKMKVPNIWYKLVKITNNKRIYLNPIKRIRTKKKNNAKKETNWINLKLVIILLT